MLDDRQVPGRAATALIIGDVQTGIVGAFPSAGSVVGPLAAVLASARATGVPVIYVRFGLRPDHAEVPSRNPKASWVFSQGELFQESSPATSIHPDLAPAPGDAVLVKRRASAFNGTDLEAILRARGITDLTMAGIATSGVVLATLIDALDRDYAVTVLRDGCADSEPDIHDFLLDRLFPDRGARVVSGQAWIDSLT